MANFQNKLSHFWQELKRRKVIHVITVYAGAAFVIIELINNITGPLRLPEWTPTLIIILLLIGFPIAAIFSWIYDIHPTGGVVKTDLADKATSEDIPKSSNSWKIASYISFLVILGLIVLNIIPRSPRGNKGEIPVKSLAILPFINDSPDKENMYFINGTMEAILNNLSKIEDLRVISRTTVEQYRTKFKPLPDIAKEINVTYILEGSCQKYGNRVKLSLQLIDALNDQHLWSQPFEKEINIDEIFQLQSEIALIVAEEIKAIITPEEKEYIEEAPTTSLQAYDYYQRALEEQERHYENGNQAALRKSDSLLYLALEYDSEFAVAYAELAWNYYEETRWREYFSENYLDSTLHLSNVAISYDEKCWQAYGVKGMYYYETGEAEDAINEFDVALDLNPNFSMALYYRGVLYQNLDIVKSISNLHEALLRTGNKNLAGLNALRSGYMNAGFIDKAKELVTRLLNNGLDSVYCFNFLATIAWADAQYDEAIYWAERTMRLDSSDYFVSYYSLAGLDQEAYQNALKNIETNKNSDTLLLQTSHRLGYALWQVGLKEEAMLYFNQQLEYSTKIIELGRGLSANYFAHYDLAGTYAFLGEREKAYSYLNILGTMEFVPYWMVNLISNDPLFNSLRQDKEFQQIILDLEAKYQAEHERVRQWLEENDML